MVKNKSLTKKTKTMKRNVIKACILGMLFFAGNAAFSASEKTTEKVVLTETQCNAGETGVCVDVTEGKGCKRIDPDFIGDCGGTSQVPVIDN